MNFLLLLQAIPVALLLFCCIAAALVSATVVIYSRSRGSRVWAGWRPYVLIPALAIIGGSIWGLFFVGFTVGLSGNAAPEWTDHHAPALEPLLRKSCTDFVAGGHSVGLVVAVVNGDETCVMGFGRPSLVSGKVVTDATLFEIGSITKTFTGLLLASEIRQGRVWLDQPIQELLPAEVVLRGDARKITLRQLTTHSSGLPRLPGGTMAVARANLAMLLFGTNPYATMSEASYLTDLQNAKLEFSPGKKSSYSNFGVAILGCLLSKAAGRDYEDLVVNEICHPLGMAGTTIALSESQQKNFASGYRLLEKWGPISFGLRANPWDKTRNVEGACGLRSNGRDMLQYLLAEMRPETSPLEPDLHASQEELFRENERNAIAMGWVLTQAKSSKTIFIWHNGATAGFRSFIGFERNGRRGVAVMSNSTEAVDRLAWGILRAMPSTNKGG